MAYDDNDYFDDGEHERSNRIYLNLRAGYIAETQKVALDENGEPVQREVERWEKEGYRLEHNDNKSGKRTYFMAKYRNPISGYVTGLKWYANELKDYGVTVTGWKVTVATPKQEYVIQIGSKDRAFGAFMNSILNADLNRTIKFNGYKKDGKKGFLLYHGQNKGTDFIPGKYQLCMQDLLLQEKILQKVPLTEEDRKRVIWEADGTTPKVNYPYVKQLFDQTWDFNQWNQSLKRAVEARVIPAIEEANQLRGDWKQTEPELTHTGLPVDPDEHVQAAAAGADAAFADEAPPLDLPDPDEAAERAAIQGAPKAANADDDIPF